MISNSAGNYRGIRYLERSKLSSISHFNEISQLCLRISNSCNKSQGRRRGEREAPIIGVKSFLYYLVSHLKNNN